MWDNIITIVSFLIGAWFIFRGAVIRHRSPATTLPKPRFPPLGQKEREGEEYFEFLLSEVVRLGGELPVHVPGTGSQVVPVVPTDTSDTNGENKRYQQVLSFIKEGYSGNQIYELLGGKRADVLGMVKKAKRELGM